MIDKFADCLMNMLEDVGLFQSGEYKDPVGNYVEQLSTALLEAISKLESETDNFALDEMIDLLSGDSIPYDNDYERVCDLIEISCCLFDVIQLDNSAKNAFRKCVSYVAKEGAFPAITREDLEVIRGTSVSMDRYLTLSPKFLMEDELPPCLDWYQSRTMNIMTDEYDNMLEDAVNCFMRVLSSYGLFREDIEETSECDSSKQLEAGLVDAVRKLSGSMTNDDLDSYLDILQHECEVSDLSEAYVLADIYVLCSLHDSIHLGLKTQEALKDCLKQLANEFCFPAVTPEDLASVRLKPISIERYFTFQSELLYNYELPGKIDWYRQVTLGDTNG